MNDNDQVVPSMSSKSDAMPASVSRKRRRSTSEKLSNNISPRGITVEHVPNDARQLNLDNIGQLQQLFISNRNRLNSLGLNETVRPTTPSLYAPGVNRFSATSASAFRLFSNRNGASNASNGGRNAPSNTFPPRVARLAPGMSTSNTNWRFLRLGNSMLNDLFRGTVVGSNPNTSTANRLSEQMRLIRRLRRAQPSTTNPSGR